MTIIEKLDLLMLSKDERTKAEEKFLATLALVSDEELREVTSYLSTQGVQIAKAREIKVVANSKDEIAKKFSILSEIHETDIYKQDPGRINHNVIDVYKKIQYCKQIGKPYKKEDGTYETFLFDEALWQQVAGREEAPVATPQTFTPAEEEIITFAPEVTPAIEPEEPSKVEPAISPVDDSKYMDIKDYMAASEDMEALEAKTTNFATIRQELEGQLAELDALRNDLNFSDEISFTDLEPESYGMGRAA